MSGQLIAVVGPSGVGKDSVMAALVADDPALRPVRRVITRAADAGGEAFEAVTQAQFDQMSGAGGFALHWQAHGLSYGIPARAVQDVQGGQTLLVNLSRGVLRRAQEVFGALTVLSLTAHPDILAQRLAGRGREAPTDQAARLARAALALAGGLARVHVIDNSGALADTVRVCRAALQAERA